MAFGGVTLSVDPGPPPPSKRGAPTGLAVLGVLVLVIMALEFYLAGFSQVSPLVIGLGSLLALWLTILFMTGNPNPFIIAVGSDKRLSLSIWQTAMWLFVVVYGYNVLLAYNAQARTNLQQYASKVPTAEQDADAANKALREAKALTQPLHDIVAKKQLDLDKADNELKAKPTDATAATAKAKAQHDFDEAVAAAKVADTKADILTLNIQATTKARALTVAVDAQRMLDETARNNPYLPFIGFPASILLVLGFSVTSLIGAAGIASSQAQAGTSPRLPPLDKPDLSPGFLFADDDGRFNLTRFQNVVWTTIAVGQFALSVCLVCATASTTPITSLPDIGNALVLLMGIGQFTYLAGKLVLTGRPVIQSVLNESSGRPGGTVAITGFGFGEKAEVVGVYLSGQKVDEITNCSSTSIAFKIPPKDITNGGADWPPSEQVRLAVAVAALQSDAVDFTVYTRPVILSASRLMVKPAQDVELTGIGFAGKDDKSGDYKVNVYFGDVALESKLVAVRTSRKLQFTVPDTNPNGGGAWASGSTTVKLSVGLPDWKSAPTLEVTVVS